MAQVGRDTHLAPCCEDLLKVKLLRRSRNIPDGIGLPALLSILKGGQISGCIQEAAVAFADEARLLLHCRNFREENTDSAFAELGDFLGEETIHQWTQGIVVKALPEALVKGDVEQAVETLELLPGEGDRLLPDLEILRIPLLELNEFEADGFLERGIVLLQRIDLAVEADQLGDRSLF